MVQIVVAAEVSHSNQTTVIAMHKLRPFKDYL